MKLIQYETGMFAGHVVGVELQAEDANVLGLPQIIQRLAYSNDRESRIAGEKLHDWFSYGELNPVDLDLRDARKFVAETHEFLTTQGFGSCDPMPIAKMVTAVEAPKDLHFYLRKNLDLRLATMRRGIEMSRRMGVALGRPALFAGGVRVAKD